MKRSPLTLLFIFAVFSLFLLSSGCSKSCDTTEFWAMDTYCNITVYGGSSVDAETAVKEAENLLENSGGENKSLFAENKKTFAVDNEISEALTLSLDISEKTDGLFDITIAPLTKLWNVSERTEPPSEKEIDKAVSLVDYRKLFVSGSEISFSEYEMGIDIGAIGKGIAAKKATEALAEKGLNEAVINLGGNVTVIGNKNGEGYKIGIKDPLLQGILGYVTVSDTSVVTSGSYERNFTYDGKTYHHIIDPSSGYPSESGLLSATVICKNPVAADALSTAFFIVGEKGAASLFVRCQQYGLDGVILVTEEKNIVLIGNAKDIFVLSGEGYSIEE